MQCSPGVGGGVLVDISQFLFVLITQKEARQVNSPEQASYAQNNNGLLFFYNQSYAFILVGYKRGLQNGQVYHFDCYCALWQEKQSNLYITAF